MSKETGINKQIDFIYGDNNSEVFSLIHSSNFEKKADYSPELVTYINELKALQDKTYALVNALSAGEYYGSNRNGDYFPSQSLKEYHKTFEAMGHVYEHHVNKDPQKSLGKVVFSHYNPNMHRVELIIELDNAKAAHIIKKLDNGDLPAVSMGCRVPWDECSICGHRAKNRTEYCDHLKNQMNRVLAGGVKVYAINRMPKFFDISIVIIPAEETAGFLKIFKNLPVIIDNGLKKVASFNNYSYIKIAELNSYAEIKKEVAGTIEAVSDKPETLLQHIKNRMSDNVLKKLANYPIHEVLSTMLGLRIFPVREDFQKLALYASGQEVLAQQLEKDGVVFEINTSLENVDLSQFSPENCNIKIAEILEDSIPEVALTKEYVVARGLKKIAEDQTKQPWPPAQPPVERSLLGKIFFGQTPDPATSPEKNPIVPLGILGSLYYGYSKLFNDTSNSGFRAFMAKNPWLLPVLIGGAAIGSLQMQRNEFDKTASAGVDKFFRNSLLSFPLAYYYAGKAENEARQGKEITPTQNFVRKHPTLTALVASLGATKIEKLVDKSSGLKKIANFVFQLPETELNKLYHDILNN